MIEDDLRNTQITPANLDQPEPLSVDVRACVTFEEAVDCVRRHYGDRIADRWRNDNADSWNVTEGERQLPTGDGS